MRFFLLVLLLTGFGYFGFQAWSHRGMVVRPGPGHGESAGQGNPGLDNPGSVSGDQGPSEPVVFAGTGDSDAEMGPIRDLDPVDPRTRRLDSRWRNALISGRLDRVERQPEIETKLVPGTGGYLALQVASALVAADESSAALAQAADALVESAPESAPALVAAAVATLLQKSKRLAAVSALGASNSLLWSKDAEVRIKALLDSANRLTDSEKVVHLSRLVDVLTRGRPFWESPRARGLIDTVYKQLTGVLRRTVFNPSGSWRSRHHEVRRNETLQVICRRYAKELGIKLSVGLVQMVNRIPSPKQMRADITLRIPTSELRVVVEKPTHVMKVFLGPDVIIRVYRVGLGKDGGTPSAQFTILEKQEKPDWYPPSTSPEHPAGRIPYGSPKNPLGDYFIKLEHATCVGFGIHGTKDQSSLGKNASLGCIRLGDLEMVDAFALLPRGITVEIR